ncbi:hypothetical protein K4F52_007570 [Lecanicillium sp. MT-2017a]|nr:hypothetical protein K4F52_007570 [Lecanicillium sp. MT-2017a]
MSPGTISPLSSIKALTFDVFGTVVDWRGTVTEELTLRIHRKLTAASDDGGNISPAIRARLEALNREDEVRQQGPEGPNADGWIARFVAEWRDSYKKFTRSFDAATMVWKDVDAHHYDSLVDQLEEWQLEGLFSPVELASLSLVWHRLTPWEDSVDGLRGLTAMGLTNATLSNGNMVLLRDLADFSDLSFDKLFSAETFGEYKPSAGTYRGAVRDLNMQPGDVAMVAAHLGDLQAAKSQGLRTVYIERPREEDWPVDDEKYRQAQDWVDLWIPEGEGGIGKLVKTLKEVKGQS